MVQYKTFYLYGNNGGIDCSSTLYLTWTGVIGRVDWSAHIDEVGEIFVGVPAVHHLPVRLLPAEGVKIVLVPELV